VYELEVKPSLPFKRGDVLGIFQPTSARSRLRIRYVYRRLGSGYPQNFLFRLADSITEPISGSFTTMSSGIILQTTVMPLVTVEICKPYICN